MHKFSTRLAAAAIAIACGFAAPGFAQTATGVARVTAEHGVRASKMVGMSVYNDGKNQNIGSILDIMVDKTTGIATAILSVGNFVGGGSRLVEVPLGHVAIDGSKAMMAGATKQVLAAMPVYNFGGGN